MNGSPNLGTADKSSSGLNAAIIWAGAMAAMDMVAVAVAAGAVAVATVATVEAGIIMEAVEAEAKIMSGMLMRPREHPFGGEHSFPISGKYPGRE